MMQAVCWLLTVRANSCYTVVIVLWVHIIEHSTHKQIILWCAVIKDDVPIETGDVLYEKSGLHCYQPFWCCIVPALLISPSPMWNMSRHREQFAASNRSVPWPQVFFSRKQGGGSTQPGKTSEALAMVGTCGSPASGWFLAEMMIFFFFFPHCSTLLKRMGGRCGGGGVRVWVYVCIVFLWSQEWVLFTIHLHSLSFSSIPHQNLPFLAMLSAPEWPLLEDFWPAVKIDFFKTFLYMTQIVLRAELETFLSLFPIKGIKALCT